MERLTKKINNPMKIYDFKNKKYVEEININAVLYKLGQLEDIEQELGIDLIVLINILKSNSIYTKNERYDNSNSLSYMGNSWLIFNATSKKCFQFKDFGKIWALTEEELK